MARVTREIGAAWVNEAILVLDGAAPSRHFWSRWMDRALAAQGTRLVQRRVANDSAPTSDELDEAAENEPADQIADQARLALVRFD